MGEHDIAVSLDRLKFVEEPVRTSSASTSTTGTASDKKVEKNATSYDWVPDHALMDGTKEQLKALPEFKYSNYN